MRDVDIAYIAGLFDGEGTVGFYKRYETKKDRKGKPRKSLCNRISVEIAMTERSVRCNGVGVVVSGRLIISAVSYTRTAI